HYLGEEDVGAVARRVDAGVLPKPADAGPDGDGPFHRRTGVDEGRKGHRATDPLREEGDDGVELFLENRMVVSPPRVAGDQAPELAARRRVMVFLGVVGDGDGDRSEEHTSELQSRE